MSGVTVQPLAGPYELSEGPHWDEVSKKLYFVDIFAQKIYRYDPAKKSLTSACVGKCLDTCISPCLWYLIGM